MDFGEDFDELNVSINISWDIEFDVCIFVWRMNGSSNAFNTDWSRHFMDYDVRESLKKEGPIDYRYSASGI